MKGRAVRWVALAEKPSDTENFASGKPEAFSLPERNSPGRENVEAPAGRERTKE